MSRSKIWNMVALRLSLGRYIYQQFFLIKDFFRGKQLKTFVEF
jgi:hypothetical protein